MTAAKPHPQIPLPTGAVKADDWCDVGHPDQSRLFNGPERIVEWRDAETDWPEKATMYVSGCQRLDGRVDGQRGIRIGGIGWEDSLPASAARELSKALAELASELEQLEEGKQPT